MFRFFLLGALALALGGCDMAGGVFMSRADKVNAAFPLPEELITAQNSLFKSVTDEKETARLKAQYAQVMELRALTCSSSTEFGRFTTVADVRKRITDLACFREQNTAVAEWVGLQRFLIAVRMPPLVPFAPLKGRTVIPSLKGEGPNTISLAQSANVAVIATNRGSYVTVELPSGKAIANFPGGDRASGYPAGPLSPNGRVLVLRMGDGLRMVDTETGTVLWSTTKYVAHVAWLPELEASLLAARPHAAPVLLDHRTGKTDPYAVPVANLSWAAPIGGGKARVLLGDNMNAMMVDNSRGSDGAIAATVVKQWRLATQGMTSPPPIVMAGGRKMVYLSMRDLAWLEFDTDKQGVWNTGSINAVGFAKISENALYLDAAEMGGLRSWLFDIDKETVATVPRSSETEGLLMPLSPRTGYVRRGYQALVIGTDVTTEGEPQPLDKLIADKQLEQQLAKLNPPQPLNMPAPFLAPAPVFDPQGRTNAVAAANAAAAAAALAGMSPAGLPRIMPATPAPVVPVKPLAPIAPGEPPMVWRGVPPEAQVQVVGVYEPHKRQGTGGPDAGVVRVRIESSSVPLVLVLANYEPVEWRIANRGRPIAAILLSGYNPAKVTGIEARTVAIGGAMAYEAKGEGYVRLREQIARYVSNPVKLFQGQYSGAEFVVPAN